MSLDTVCFLFDNGSLRPEPTKSLRHVARALSNELRRPVTAVSLLHSSAVDARELGGEPAQLLEPALRAALAAGERAFLLIPLFFGPSAALTEYLPERLRALTETFPDADFQLARPVMDLRAPSDRRVADALADHVRRVVLTAGLIRPPVVLVDHGSPQPAVTAVRNELADQVAACLGEAVAGVWPASMERRPGDAYAFNEPLLCRRLRLPPTHCGDVVLALQFFSGGRHAGEGGDIAQLCAEAEAANPGLRVHRTPPLEADARLVAVLADRAREKLRA